MAYTTTNSTAPAAAVYAITRSQTRRYPHAPRAVPVPTNPQNATMPSITATAPMKTRA